MPTSDPQQPAASLERFARERRQFLTEGSIQAGTGILAAMGLGQYARAQSQAAPPGASQGGTAATPPGLPPSPAGPGGRPPLPPEPAVAQPAPLRDLKGKTAYITAASDGIGLGIARAAANAGMKVVIGYRNEERLKAALPLFPKGSPVLPFRHDVTDRDGWAKMLQTVNQQLGNLHLVVNNAGVKTWTQVHSVSAADWDNAVAVNFTATYSSVATCLPHMLQHGEGGHFVVTSSMSGLLPGGPLGVYTATKIAVVGLIEALRVELEGTTVGTSAFCPGGVNTDNYLGTGEDNPYLAALLAKRGGAPRAGKRPPPGMDPLEAGERVLNGVIHNDLFILTHPEYMPGTARRFDAMLESEPKEDMTMANGRAPGEARVLHAGIYKREIVHRRQKRKSFRSVTLDT